MQKVSPKTAVKEGWTILLLLRKGKRKAAENTGKAAITHFPVLHISSSNCEIGHCSDNNLFIEGELIERVD